MHPILTQGLLPAKAAGQQPASNSDIENTKSGAGPALLLNETDASFITVFGDLAGKPREKTANVDLAVEVSESLPATSDQKELRIPDGLTEANVTSAAMPIGTLRPSLEHSGGNTPPPEIAEKIAHSGGQAVVVPEPRQALEQQVAVPTQYADVERTAKVLPLSELTDTPIEQQRPASSLTSPLPLQKTSGKQAVLSDFAATSPSSKTSAPALLKTPGPIAQTTANQALATKTISAMSSTNSISASVQAPTRTPPLTAQLTATTASFADMTPRKPARDQTTSTVPAVQTSTSVQKVSPITSLPFGAVVSPSQPNQMIGLDTANALSKSGESEPLVGVRSDVSVTTSVHQPQSMHPTAQLPQSIARQMAEAVQSLPNRPVEISLSPEELGRVRLVLSTSEAGIVVNVLAERQETAELIRRHISHLEAAFQDIGYSDIAFSFSGGAQAQEDAERDTATASENSWGETNSDEHSAKAAQINMTTGIQAGLDIRL